MNDDHVRPETYGQMERRLKRELAAAQADAERWCDACVDPIGYAHLFTLLAQGKGTVESLNTMADRIGVSRRAAIAKGLGPGPCQPLKGAKL